MISSKNIFTLSAAGLLAASLPALGGPLDTYYLTAPNSGKLFGIQGSSVTLNRDLIFLYESPLAVISTIRTFSALSGFSGAEYNFDGTATSATYFNNFPGAYFIDGTTDGTFNYAWHFVEGAAYRFNLDWSSPTVLFTLGNDNGSRLGITYDPTNNSLWVSGFNNSVIENRSLAGALLSSFTIPSNQIIALAFDSGDSTLWLGHRDYTGTFEQYSRTGTLISTETYAQLASLDVFGGEFVLGELSSIPEPASFFFGFATILAGGLSRGCRRSGVKPRG